MIQHPDLQPFANQYLALPKAPLRVVAHLTPGQQLVHCDNLHLDGLLAAAAVRLATSGAGLPDASDAYDIPLPLDCLWRSEAGHPLWAATDFFPVGSSALDAHSLQKRPVDGRYSKPNTRAGNLDIVTIKGRHMARMIAASATVADAWEAWCIGDAATVQALLAGFITHLGKHRGRGFGEVARWEVEPCTEFVLHKGGKTLRPLPFTPGWDKGFEVAGRLALVGWTPPHWKPSLFSPGWPAGSGV